MFSFLKFKGKNFDAVKIDFKIIKKSLAKHQITLKAVI